MATTEAPVATGSGETRTSRMLRSRYFFPILILFIVIGFYWKLTLTRQFEWMWGPDLAQQVLPWFEEEARQLQHSEVPLWDPHTWGGQPMLGQAQPGTAYPLNWILFLIPRAHGHIARLTLEWYFVIIHFMAALFAFLLCRDLGRSRAASLIGGLIFSLAAFVGTNDWPQMLNGAIWAPLVFLFVLRAVRGYRPVVSAALCGAFLGMAWLSGHHQAPMYIALAMGFTWAYFILREGRINWNFVKLAATVLIFMLLVGALQIIPAEEYGHLAKRWVGAENELRWDEPVPYYVHREYATNPMSLFAILIPGMNRHSDPFIGVVAFSLALLAIALCWKAPAVKLFGAIALGALVYSLGPNSVFHGFLYSVVPMLEKARVASMAGLLWGFGAAVLAAFGVDRFALASGSLWARRIVRGVLGFGILIYLMLLGALFVNKMIWSVDDRVAMTAFVTVLLAALLYGWNSGSLKSGTAIVLLTLLLLLELGNDAGYTLPDRSNKDQMSFSEKTTGNADIAGFLHRQPGAFRVEVRTESLALNWAEYYDFDAITTYLAGLTSNILEMEAHTWQTRMLFGVRYTVSEKPPLGDSKDVFTGASGLKVFENPNAFPRVWSVHQWTQIKDLAEGRSMISDHLDQLHVQAFSMEKPVSLQSCPGVPDQVSVKKYTAEKVTLTADMGCQGMVVLSDTFFPGWKADLDGKPIAIHSVDLALRGMVVPQGKHEIVLRFRPASVYLGAALTALGWLGAIGLVIFGPKRDENE